MKSSWTGLGLDCPSCRGSGIFKEKARVKCATCGGTGKVGVIGDGSRKG